LLGILDALRDDVRSRALAKVTVAWMIALSSASWLNLFTYERAIFRMFSGKFFGSASDSKKPASKHTSGASSTLKRSFGYA
jgi:hypothetical protein